MGDMLRLIWWAVIGLFRSKTSLEAEILTRRGAGVWLDACRPSQSSPPERPSRQAPTKTEQARPWQPCRHALQDVGAFVAKLREREAITSIALEFLNLTAARTGEVLGAEWPEFDLEGKVWTVSAKRMKSNREHRVPLSTRGVEIIEKLRAARTGAFVFPGISRSQARHW